MFNLNKIAALLLIALITSGCSDSDNTSEPEIIDPPEAVEYQYKVTINNLTNAQPLSPIAAILHSTGNIWTLGEPASDMLEALAESGDNSGLLSAGFVVDGQSNGDVLLPGMQTEILLTTTDEMATRLSLATMLVNTNDGFSGLDNVELNQLNVDDMLLFKVPVFDAGTEANTESAGSIPGPADSGEGFNPVRDDVNFVSRHSGIVSIDDGLSSSILNNQHKFDNPAMSVKIMRVK